MKDDILTNQKIRTIIEKNKPERLKIAEAGLTEAPSRKRMSLTGQRRNEAESKRFRSLLDGALTHWKYGRRAEARSILLSLHDALDGIRNALVPEGVPVYAPIEYTPEGRTRAIEDALAVACANVRRAVGAGRPTDVEGFLLWLLENIDVA